MQKPVAMEMSEQIATAYPIAKVVYSNLKQTYFVWEKNSPYIHIYYNGDEINRIGGLGLAEGNFQKLTDIGVFSDGTFFGLDSFPKKLRRFDEKGKFLADFDLSFAQEPTLFATNNNNQLIVYDQGQRELVHVAGLANTEVFRFGKFQVEHVQEIAISGDYLFVYQSEPSETVVFSLLGQFLRSLPGKVITDAYGNDYLLEAHFIKLLPHNQGMANSPDTFVNLHYAQPYLITNTDTSIQRWQIQYENQP
jgi:hypothetical protein